MKTYHRHAAMLISTMRLMFLLGVMLSSITAPTPGLAAATVTLQGIVETGSGHPLRGAYVASESFTARTDRSGHYVLQRPAVSQLLVFVWAPGYRRSAATITAQNGGLLVGPVIANFTGIFALRSAFQNPIYRASLHGLPIRMNHRVRNVHLWGTVAVPLEPLVAVILPNGLVQNFRLHVRGSHFDAWLRFRTNGMYWVEINARSGFAVFDILVFRGEKPTPPQVPYFPPEPVHAMPDQLAQYALFDINHVRETLGRRPLVMQPQLLRAAVNHCQDILQHGYYLAHPHIGSDGSTLHQRITRSGLRVRASGEAVGEGNTVAETVVRFVESAAHRSILIGHYRWAGIAVIRTNTGILMTVDLAR